jgi:hypothetical protein
MKAAFAGCRQGEPQIMFGQWTSSYANALVVFLCFVCGHLLILMFHCFSANRTFRFSSCV